MKDNIKMALAQINSKREDKAANLQTLRGINAQSQKTRSRLSHFSRNVIDRLCAKDQVYELAEPIPGPSVAKVEALAKKTGMHIIFGMPEVSEKTKATLYNTAVFVGPDGYIGKYHKMYLPTHSVFEEKRYFRPGYQPAVFETAIGRIGLTICYDVFFPEVFRLARLGGAQLIVCISASPAVRRSYFEILTASQSHRKHGVSSLR